MFKELRALFRLAHKLPSVSRGVLGVLIILYLALSTPVFANDKIALGNWREALITTQDPQPWLHLLTEFSGWEVRSDTAIEAGLLKSWNAPEGVSGRDILLANKGTERGFIRLIHLQDFPDNAEQDWIRADDRPWDTGGIFDLNIRVKDLIKSHKRFRAMGWQGDSTPNQIVFGKFEVVEWIARGPDGVRLAFIERIKPKLKGYEFDGLSRVFNSTQTVADIDRSLVFYRDVLGMKVNIAHKAASEKAGPNVLGLPQEITTQVPREVYVLNREGETEGSIEILAFNGATGSDLSAKAAPYNIGLSVLRYQVDDLQATMAGLKARGAKFSSAPVELQMPPYGRVKLVALIAPEGARLEIFSLIK